MPKWLRAAIPAILILVWLSIGGIGGPYFGKISQVSSNDATSYLPASSDATKVQNLQVKFSSKKVLPAVVLYVLQIAYSDDRAVIQLTQRRIICNGA